MNKIQLKNLIKYTIRLPILIPITILALFILIVFSILDIGLIVAQIILFGCKKPFMTLTGKMWDNLL